MELARRDEQQRRVTESVEKARAALEPGRGRGRRGGSVAFLDPPFFVMAAHVVDNGSGLLLPGFPGVLQSLLDIFGIVVGLDQTDSYAARCLAHRRFLQWHVHDWYC